MLYNSQIYVCKPSKKRNRKIFSTQGCKTLEKEGEQRWLKGGIEKSVLLWYEPDRWIQLLYLHSGSAACPHVYYEPSSCIYPGSGRISSTTSFCCQCLLYAVKAYAVARCLIPEEPPPCAAKKPPMRVLFSQPWHGLRSGQPLLWERDADSLGDPCSCFFDNPDDSVCTGELLTKTFRIFSMLSYVRVWKLVKIVPWIWEICSMGGNHTTKTSGRSGIQKD